MGSSQTYDLRLRLTWESNLGTQKSRYPKCVETINATLAEQQPPGAPLTPKGGKTKTSMPHSAAPWRWSSASGGRESWGNLQTVRYRMGYNKYIYIYMYILIYIYIYVCMYFYIYICMHIDYYYHCFTKIYDIVFT